MTVMDRFFCTAAASSLLAATLLVAPAKADATKAVPGPLLSARANWNQTNDAKVEYDAPAGWHVVSAKFIIDSVGNNLSYNVNILATKAIFYAQAHGSGKWYDQYGGWFSAHTEVTIGKDD
jgi:hypothetical protein